MCNKILIYKNSSALSTKILVYKISPIMSNKILIYKISTTFCWTIIYPLPDFLYFTHRRAQKSGDDVEKYELGVDEYDK